LEILQPEQIESAFRAVQELERRSQAVDQQWRLRLERLEYQALEPSEAMRKSIPDFVFCWQTRPTPPTESSSRWQPSRDAVVTDWSLSPRCSPPRIAATQLRFDTAQLFTAQKRTFTVLSTRHFRRTGTGQWPVPSGDRRTERVRRSFCMRRPRCPCLRS
jgi:hypothetical protein